jgi:membrane protein
MNRPGDAVGLVAAIARTVLEEKLRYPAAALAYYAFVSLVPVLLLAFVLVGRSAATELSRTVPRLVTPQVRVLIAESIATGAGRTGAGVFAVGVLLWSGANFVGDVRTVFARVERSGPTETTVRRWLRDAAVVLTSVGVAIPAMVATSLLFTVPPSGPVEEVAAFLGLWLTLGVIFVPLYYVPSRVVKRPREAVPGAAVAALGWTVIHTLAHFYAVNAGSYALYGVLSGVVVVLTGLYLAASALLTGIVVNAVVSGESAAASG